MSKIKILANDGIHIDGQQKLEAAGFEVDTNKIAQEDLTSKLQDYEVILVRSATKVRQELIDVCPNLKIIGRGGVGLDNIDVSYAKDKGVAVYNTPAASSKSVAELVFAHIFTLARGLHSLNREMPEVGNSKFKALKKGASKGMEVRGKSIGIVGFGRIGQEVARIAIGLGMNVLAVDPFSKGAKVSLNLFQHQGLDINVDINTVSMDEMLANADMITLHVPSQDKPVLGKEEMAKMKDGVMLINAARGGVIDEEALLEALDSGKVRGAGLDVFVNEPTPNEKLLNHDKISLSPHTGAATLEAQSYIGLELAEKIIAFYNK